MTTSALVSGGTHGVMDRPSQTVLWGVGLAGCAAASCSVWLAFSSDHVDEPAIQSALMVWMVLAYVFGGLVAWWRRPGRFGPLMIAAGFTIFASSLAWSNASVAFTVGITFDLVAAVVFMHVFLAFPSGYLRSWPERALLGIGYVTAFGLQIVGLVLGGFGPDNVLELVSEPGAAQDLFHVQLVVLSAVSLAAIVVLVARRRSAGRPLRRSLALLVDSFAVVLVMIAFLFISAAFGLVEGEAEFEAIRRATFVAIGLAPLVFLFGLLHARLLRSGVGELDARPPRPIRRLDVSGTRSRTRSATLHWHLRTGCRTSRATPTSTASPSCFHERAGRERSRSSNAKESRSRPCCTTRRCETNPSCSTRVTAAAGIALENARLQADLSARVEELARVPDAGDRGGADGATAPRAKSPRWCTATVGRALARPQPTRIAAR